MFFKVTTYEYFLKISITHNKKQISLLNLLIKCTSTRSAPQMLSLKDECTFHFSNFVITGLCNSSANSWLDINSLLIATPVNLFYVAKVSNRKVSDSARLAKEVSYQKIYERLKQDLFDIHHISDF